MNKIVTGIFLLLLFTSCDLINLEDEDGDDLAFY